MSTGKPKHGDTRLVVAATTASALMETKKADHGGSTSIVEYKPPVMLEDEEDLEIKLRRILENVPVRVSNTSGSSAGSGSGDFHQYRQMRRREQDRLTRMDIDYNKRLQMAEFTIRREEKLKAAEEKTSKKRLKRQKKKQRKQEKKSKPNTTEEQEKQPREEISSDDEEEEDSVVEEAYPRPIFNKSRFQDKCP